MVLPTNLNPRFLRSALKASDCGGVTGVAGHVRGSSRVTGGAGGGAGRTFIGGAGGGVGGNCRVARLAALDLTTRPCARGFDGFARPVVFRVLLLEVREHMLGADGGPERQFPLIM